MPSAGPGNDERQLERRWLLGVVVAASVLFLSTIGTNVEFGDGAEAVAGIGDLGIVHAPGYFSYTVCARAFTTLVPVGDLAFRVMLFSTVCAVATIGFVFLVARRLTASRAGAAVGALGLAVSSTFWFDAGYAKSYAFTSLLIAVVLWCLLAWKDGGRRWLLAVAGGLVGLSLGASWQSMAVALPGFALILWSRDRRPLRRDVIVVVVSGLAVALVVAVGVLVRASMDPRVNWGDATAPRHLVDLFLVRDFVNLSGGAGGSGSTSVASASAIGALFSKMLRIPFFITADAGIALLALLAVGVVVAAVRRTATRFWALLSMWMLNFVAVALVISPGIQARGFKVTREALLRFGGYQLSGGIVVACGVAIGVTWLLERAALWLAGPVPERDRRHRRQSAPRAVAAPVWLIVVALMIVGGTAAWNWGSASHHQPPFARDYARNVLDSLPPNAVLVSLVAERSFPIEYEQVVHHTRTDVTVVQIEALAAKWYRADVSQELGVDVTSVTNPNDAALRVVDGVHSRPVYYDYAAAASLAKQRSNLGFTKIGLVAEAQPDGAGQTYDANRADALFARFRLDGIHDDRARLHWPNDKMLAVYAVAYYDRAFAFAQSGKIDEARDQLRQMLAVDPGNADALKALASLDQHK